MNTKQQQTPGCLTSYTKKRMQAALTAHGIQDILVTIMKTMLGNIIVSILILQNSTTLNIQTGN